MKNLLFLAPLPPPINGHSLVSEVLSNYLSDRVRIKVVDLSIASNSDGSPSFKRVFEVLKVLVIVASIRSTVELSYLTISESILGNLKDLAIVGILGKRASSLVLHLHGGSYRGAVLERSRLLRRVNRMVFSRVKGAIVSGPSHANIFAGIIAEDKVSIIPNFAPEDVFVEQSAVEAKFRNLDAVRILYLSGMTPGKGYARLLAAYAGLGSGVQAKLKLDFAGKFDNDSEMRGFEQAIKCFENVAYHGVVDNAKKVALFSQAHVFCLPTSFSEGQPISILEGYASGCVVVATCRPGIMDIFVPGRNGFVVPDENIGGFTHLLNWLYDNKEVLHGIASRNFHLAKNHYRASEFCIKASKAILD